MKNAFIIFFIAFTLLISFFDSEIVLAQNIKRLQNFVDDRKNKIDPSFLIDDSSRTINVGKLQNQNVLQLLTDTTGCPTELTTEMRLTPDIGGYPTIAQQGEDYIHLTWDFDGDKLMYARSIDQGITFNVRDITDTIMFPKGVASARILASEKYVYLFFLSMSGGQDISPVYMIRSSDRGETFDTPRITTNMNAVTATFQWQAISGDTIVLLHNRYLHYSTSAGNTWRTKRNRLSFLLKESRYGLNKIIINNGIVHIIYEKYIYNKYRRRYVKEVLYRRTANLGRSWSRQRVLSAIDGNTSWNPLGLTASINGDIYASWREHRLGSYNGLSGSFAYRKSEDNGLSWGPEIALTQTPEAYPAVMPIHVNSYTGNPVAVVWTKDTTNIFFGPFISQVKARISLNRGNTWCPEVQITPEDNSGANAVCVLNSRILILYSKNMLPGLGEWAIHMRSAPFKIHSSSQFQNNGGGELGSEELGKIILEQNYPNPFNSNTNIVFYVPSFIESPVVTLKVYNLLGQEVSAIIENEQIESGEHTKEFNAAHLSSGVYYYQLNVRDDEGQVYREMKKLLIIK
ncbi:MAG: T9SS type A sorting domain-containing protein [Bacteroidota bacterium]|nr:T9SS type A sorting domain-containing protein [Bacteroidota bacterium]